MSRDDAEKPDEESEQERALDQQIAAYLRLGVPLATVVCAAVAGFARGAPAVLLVLTGGMLVAVIAIFWASLRTLVGETPLSGADAYALGAPRAAEEEKRAVLRALKDLEFERGVGKISEDDYQGLVAKYRAEAKRLLRSIDEDAQPERAKVETLVAARLHREGLADDPGPPYRASPKGSKRAKKAGKAETTAMKTEASKYENDDREATAKGQAESTSATSATCAACGTKNDADAVFCKKCGARQTSAGDAEGATHDEPAKNDEGASS